MNKFTFDSNDLTRIQVDKIDHTFLYHLKNSLVPAKVYRIEEILNGNYLFVLLHTTFGILYYM